MWLLIAFIAIPLIEIALFIQIGGFIGLWPTLAIVLALLLPPFRAAAFKYAKSKIKVQQFSMGSRPQQPQGPADRVIDGDFDVVEPKDNKPSGWTRD